MSLQPSKAVKKQWKDFVILEGNVPATTAKTHVFIRMERHPDNVRIVLNEDVVLNPALTITVIGNEQNYLCGL